MDDAQVGDDGHETPRWVKVSATIGGLIVAALVLLHLLGYGLGGHGA